jgi:predicted nucleic acid-binding protein
MICLDTNAIIDFYKEDKNLKELLDSLDDVFVTTIINYQEIKFGINPDNVKHKKEEEFYDNLFDNLILLDLDKNSAKKSSEVFWKLVKKGKIIGKFDSIIAGILIANGVDKIITRNAKHFENIKELKVINY